MASHTLTKRGEKYYLNGASQIKRKFEYSVPPHTHDFIEIVYILKGKCTHTVDGKEYPASKGDLLFINYGLTHAFESSSGFEYSELLLKPELISDSLRGNENAFSLLTVQDFKEFESTVNRDNCFVSFSGEERGVIETLFALIERENEETDKGAELIFRSALNVILTLIFRKMSLPMHREFGINEALLSYIKDNCSSHITLEYLAQKSFYTPSYFSRAFKERTGVTFTEYLAECRIAKAKKLLSDTDMPVEYVISEAGFSNRTKFFTAFYQRTGTTPLKYRKSKK